MTRTAEVSVVIPVKNGEPELRYCIEGILAQSVAPREIIVIDSGSTDGSVGIAREYSSVGLLEIRPESFDHGETRNLGARSSSGELVIMTVQDARPASKEWISELVAGLTDPGVAGVCGLQVVPHDMDKNPVEWFRPQSSPRMYRYQYDSPGEFLSLPPAEKRRACSWDNVGALYRRDVLLRIPFPRTPYGEDMLWAREALLAGLALVHNPAAQVFHYHSETAEFSFQRAVRSLYYRYVSTGDIPADPPVLREIARAGFILLREPGLTWTARKNWLRYNIDSQLAVRKATRALRESVTGNTDLLGELERIAAAPPPAPPKPEASRSGRSRMPDTR